MSHADIYEIQLTITWLTLNSIIVDIVNLGETFKALTREVSVQFLFEM